MSDLIYDIRTPILAQKTLERLTGIPIHVWKENSQKEHEFQYIEDFVENMIEVYGTLPNRYEDFKFIFSHITTSADGCSNIKQHGLLDLRRAYSNEDSELRNFLDSHGVYIDLNKQVLTYRKKQYSISYGPTPADNTIAYDCWSIGRKFYYDYSICGFLSVFEDIPYGGRIHYRPEILDDLDNLLELNMSQEWHLTHKPYEVISIIDGENIIYGSYDDDDDDKDKVLYYLNKAYFNAFISLHEYILITKNNVQLPRGNILEIRPFESWQ